MYYILPRVLGGKGGMLNCRTLLFYEQLIEYNVKESKLTIVRLAGTSTEGHRLVRSFRCEFV